MNSITKRWVRGSLLVTILMCLVAEAVFLYYSITNYYDGARRAMTTRTSTIITQLNASAAQTGESQGVLLRRMVEQFTEKDKFELMLVNAAGKPLVTSTGFAPDDSVAGEDYLEALASEKGEGHAVYRTAMGEKVMAVTTLLPRAAGEIVAVRFVTSLTLVDQSIAALVAFSLALVTAVVLFSVWTGMFFIRSIVRPIGEIEATAAKIAEGNLDTRIENKYNDEIGKLSDTINHMAGELDKTERMKNEFISSVSHELRTPLTSIKGWVETIAAIRDPADPNFRRGVQVISSEADRLYSMVEELLDFSRMQNGLKLDLQLLDLVAEVSDAAIMVERRVELEGLHLAYDEPEEPMPVMADPARLRQVFINVLDNAVKYSPPHGTVRMDVLSDGNSAFVNISDEGRGIAPDDLENVKVKFFKGKGAVRGSGIGLAVVDEIVTALDGSVDIHAIGLIVFKDRKKLAELDAIVHEHIPRALAQKMAATNAEIIGLDAIKLIESGLGAICDATVAVTAPEEVRVKRIMARDSITEEYARSRIAAQKDADYFRAQCDYEFVNDLPTAEKAEHAAEVYINTIINNLKEETER